MEAWWGHCSLCPFKRGAAVVEVSYHNNIIGNFMVYQDRLETNLCSYFEHPENSEWVSIITVIIFAVKIVNEQKQTYSVTIFFCFFKFPLPSTLLLLPLPYPLLQHPWICMLCQQTSPKHWFANVNMTSYCDVTNSVYPITKTTIRHCSILEIGRGASNQAVAPGITRPLHATDCSISCNFNRTS